MPDGVPQRCCHQQAARLNRRALSAGSVFRGCPYAAGANIHRLRKCHATGKGKHAIKQGIKRKTRPTGRRAVFFFAVRITGSGVSTTREFSSSVRTHPLHAGVRVDVGELHRRVTRSRIRLCAFEVSHAVIFSRPEKP